MPRKLAVLLVHGIDRHNLDDIEMDAAKKQMIQTVKTEFARLSNGVQPETALEFEIVVWALQAGLQNRKLDFMQMMTESGVKMGLLREFMLDIIASSAAYQSRLNNRHGYEEIHSAIALGIRNLARRVGETAPLFVVAHSIGALMIQQYFYDLQWDSPKRQLLPPNVRQIVGIAPIEKGHTLTSIYSLGNPAALWLTRFENFGTPLIVPAPELKNHYPNLRGRWANIYDKDDVLAYPLKPLNAEFEKIVDDVEVNVGGIFESWNPASHLAYWTDKNIARMIATDLAAAWKTLNP
jgi:hypothetical protein